MGMSCDNKPTQTLNFFCDTHRHLVCSPYTLDNLHQMAYDLGIKRCWFHKNHYDIPKKRIEEIQNKCQVVTPKEILRIIKSGHS